MTERKITWVSIYAGLEFTDKHGRKFAKGDFIEHIKVPEGVEPQEVIVSHAKANGYPAEVLAGVLELPEGVDPDPNPEPCPVVDEIREAAKSGATSIGDLDIRTHRVECENPLDGWETPLDKLVEEIREEFEYPAPDSARDCGVFLFGMMIGANFMDVVPDNLTGGLAILRNTFDCHAAQCKHPDRKHPRANAIRKRVREASIETMKEALRRDGHGHLADVVGKIEDVFREAMEEERKKREEEKNTDTDEG